MPDCKPKIDFRTDGTYLIPYINGVPGEGVDLKRIIKEAETNTRLQYDATTKRIVFTNEKGATDSVTVSSLIGLLSIQDFLDVAGGFPSNGDTFTYDAASQIWRPYTIPLGTIVSIVGVDEDGKLVKSESDAEPVPGGGGGAVVPIGGGITWNGPTGTVPAGFVPKDGRELSRTVYASLFNIIGVTYGAGNGTTTFNIPNTQNRVSVNKGSGQFANLGAAPGTEWETLTIGQMPHHVHHVNDPGHGHGSGANYFRDAGGAGNLGLNTPGNRFAQGLSPLYINGSATGIWLSGEGGNQAHNNVQPSLVELHLIRII